MVETIAQRHGVLHGVTQLSMVHDERGFSGLKRWISIMKQSQADFITVERLTQFERARRACRVFWERNGCLQIDGDESIDGLTLMVPGYDVMASGLAGRTAPQMVHRYGQDFVAFTLEMGEKKSISLRLFGEDDLAA